MNSDFLFSFVFSAVFTELSPFNRVAACETQCVSVKSVDIFLIFIAVPRCSISFVAQRGKPAHLLRYWSTNVSSLDRSVGGRSWTVKRNLILYVFLGRGTIAFWDYWMCRKVKKIRAYYWMGMKSIIKWAWGYRPRPRVTGLGLGSGA